jgi:hypothetical protein
MYKIRREQNVKKINAAIDSQVFESLNEYVQLYSIIQSCVIVMSGLIQTYFIRKLFQNVGSTSYTSGGIYKPKA